MAAPPLHKIPGVDAADMIAGRYRIEKVLGAGSSGFVVAARHVHQRRPVTLKILPLTTATRERALQEHLAVAQRASSLQGPHIARVLESGVADDGTPFVATERLEGRTFADELDARGSIPAPQAVRWIMQTCEALAEAHAAGIVHGDLKPQNLFLVGEPPAPSEPDARVVKVLDFGMATPVDDKTEETSPWLSSPAYLSPEQIRDPSGIDARADIWALGVILHQLVANDLPFSADTVSGMLVAVACDKPALLVGADAPFELARVVQWCLAKTPEERPRDVTELARALKPFAGADGVPLLTRIEAAFSARPAALASGSASRDDSASTLPTTLPSMPSFATGRSTKKSDPDAEHRLQWRRRAAIATVVGVGVIGIAALLSPTEKSSRPATRYRQEAPPPEALVVADEPAPLPKALPVMAIESPPEETAPSVPEAAPVAAAAPVAVPVVSVRNLAPVPAAKPVMQPTVRRDPEALRGSLRPPPPNPKGRPTLAVREDPYGKPAPRPAAPRADSRMYR